MAGSTTNIGLIKPTYSEDADVAIINENMDTLDSTISALDNGLAIVSNNNTHGAITAGQYVYVRNHGSLAEGMYTANSNIAANATLSSSNLTAVSSGSLNKLNSDLGTLNSNMNPYGTKYIRGRIDVSTGSPTTVLGKIQTFITGVVTGGNYTWFDVMLSYQGTHYFSGNLYPDKDYGDGLYIGVDGKAYKWTRLNNVDTVDEIALNGKMAIDSTSYANNKLFVAKRSGIVTLYLAGYSGNGNVTIATLGENYRPWHGLNGVVSTGSKVAFVEVGTDGALKMYNISSSDSWFGTFSFVANVL